jgi:DNA-binding winged helix-turn-helix (wHTH) protein
MTHTDNIIRFGAFEFDPERQELRKLAFHVHLSPSQLRLLTLFLAHPGELLTRDQITQRLWPDNTDPDTATQRLRTLLGDDPFRPVFLQTVHGHGVRFIAPLNPTPSLAPRPPTPPSFTRETGLFDAATMLNLQSDPLLIASVSRRPSPLEARFVFTRSRRIFWFILLTLAVLCCLAVGLSRHLATPH